MLNNAKHHNNTRAKVYRDRLWRTRRLVSVSFAAMSLIKNSEQLKRGVYLIHPAAMLRLKKACEEAEPFLSEGEGI